MYTDLPHGNVRRAPSAPCTAKAIESPAAAVSPAMSSLVPLVIIQHVTRYYTPYYPPCRGWLAMATSVACTCKRVAVALDRVISHMRASIDRALCRYPGVPQLIIDLTYGPGYRGRELAAFAAVWKRCCRGVAPIPRVMQYAIDGQLLCMCTAAGCCEDSDVHPYHDDCRTIAEWVTATG